MALLVAALVAVSGGGTAYLLAVRQPIAESKRRIWVSESQPLGEFADALHKRGLVRHRWMVHLAAMMKGYHGPVPAAGYRFPTNASVWDLVDRLQRGGSDFAKLRLPEGLMAKQVPERLHMAGYPRAHEFEQLISVPLPKDLRPAWLPHGKLEGYLFPNTYFIDFDAKPRAVLAQMLSLFEQQVVAAHAGELKSSKRSLHQIVTLASLVEREVIKPDERALVAGVYLNRLRMRMRLECDATVQYTLGYWKKRILFSDLKVESPYNTYLHRGLPPGPICSPGLACFLGALKPQVSPFLFYVADGSGGHTFSRTYQEHLATIKRIRRGR